MARGYRMGIIGSLSFVPEGSTVTPTDDIGIWLKCAKRSENYTTLQQVLADSTCLLALIQSQNAVNYMVRSTTWASTVCANQTAMTDIGGNNYCANTLLGNSTWVNAICNSTYFESVLNAKVPAMTSNTTPSGEVFASSERTNYEAYKSLTRETGKTALINSAAGTWGYKFVNAVKIFKFVCKEFGNTNVVARTSMFKNAIIQGSNDNSTWTDIYTIANTDNTSGKQYEYVFDNSTTYQYYRLNITSNFGNAGYTQIGTLAQFYGRVDV